MLGRFSDSESFQVEITYAHIEHSTLRTFHHLSRYHYYYYYLKALIIQII